MICDSCKNTEAIRLSYRQGAVFCDKCGDNPSFRFSDVYFNQKRGAYFDPQLAHPEKAPLGQMVHSREHKALLMREQGIFEKGDKRHGSR